MDQRGVGVGSRGGGIFPGVVVAGAGNVCNARDTRLRIQRMVSAGTSFSFNRGVFVVGAEFDIASGQDFGRMRNGGDVVGSVIGRIEIDGDGSGRDAVVFWV